MLVLLDLVVAQACIDSGQEKIVGINCHRLDEECESPLSGYVHAKLSIERTKIGLKRRVGERRMITPPPPPPPPTTTSSWAYGKVTQAVMSATNVFKTRLRGFQRCFGIQLPVNVRAIVRVYTTDCTPLPLKSYH